MQPRGNDERELFEFAVVNRERITRNSDELDRLERRLAPLENHAAVVLALTQRVEAIDRHVSTLAAQVARAAAQAVHRPSVGVVGNWLAALALIWAIVATTILATHG